MADITIDDLVELDMSMRTLRRALRDAERAAAGLTIRHPVFPDRSVNIPVTPADQQLIEGTINQAQAALRAKMNQLAAGPP